MLLDTEILVLVLDPILSADFFNFSVADMETLAPVGSKRTRESHGDMHEFMDQYLCFFSIRELVESFMIHFDDICDGKSCNFGEYLTESPDARDCSSLGVKAPYTKYPLTFDISKFDFCDKLINL